MSDEYDEAKELADLLPETHRLRQWHNAARLAGSRFVRYECERAKTHGGIMIACVRCPCGRCKTHECEGVRCEAKGLSED